MKSLVILLFVGLSFSALAQTTATKPTPVLTYGENISLEAAKKIAAAAQAFAIANQWTVVISIIDTGGNLVLLEKLDNTQIASIEVAIGKAKTANGFKRATKLLEDVVAGGGAGLRLLAFPGVFPVEGGDIILSNGKIIGAIGVSGMSSVQDGEVVKAGLVAAK